ncbi:MAG TPA: tetratricopeptide repeat protein [Blastocatellia bacterium]|nr:tetratricopeptide repeat protein [Blastocatellia bacterium]
MQRQIDVASLEELREAGDYERLGEALPTNWEGTDPYSAETICLRLLSAEMYGREGRLEGMASALEPYLEGVDNLPFLLAPRALIMVSVYRSRIGEAEEGLKLAGMARTIAVARRDEATEAEAIHAEGKALWAMNRWEDAVKRFEDAIALYAAQSRSYMQGLVYLSLGGVLCRVGKVEDARTALERAIRIMLKYRDEFSLAVARADIALALNAVGEYETSLKYLQFAYDAFDQLRHDVYKLMTLNRIAEAYLYMKEYDRAGSNIAKALEMAVATRSTQLPLIYELKGRLAVARNDLEKAERALRASIEMSDQAGARLQRAESRRTLGRVFIGQNRPADATSILRAGIEDAEFLRARLLELEMKALLAEVIYANGPVEACKLITEVEAEIDERNLPELKKVCQLARKQIDSLDHEHYFIISDARMPTLAEARVAMLKWLWARALYKARGNAREAAEQLDVTPTYIRKLTKLIPRDLLRPGRKRPKRRRKDSASATAI